MQGNMKISVVVIDSRSHQHPDWVQTCKGSILNQTRPVDELIVVDNTDRSKTIGKCWNEAVADAEGDWVFFVGDDCFIARDCVQVMLNHADDKINCVTTFMTMFDEKKYKVVQRPCTGMWKRDYLLKYPFNETLDKGIDREYYEEAVKRGDAYHLIPYYFGHYDRRHDDHRSGKVTMSIPEKSDIYVTSSGGVNFVTPLVAEWRKTKKVFTSAQPFDPLIKADIIWCEWANDNAVRVADFKTDAKKFLRLHSYEAFSPYIYQIDFEKFDKVFFIADHIKEFVESKIGKIENAVVVPVGINTSKFSIGKNKNPKYVAYAGQISRKKGVGELILIANSFPDYWFYVAGKFVEDDVARYFNENKPRNIIIEPFSYDLNKFFENKSFIINTSLREGNPITVAEAMSCGLRPIVNNFIGAKDLYKPEWVYKNIRDIGRMLEGENNPQEYRDYVTDKWNLDETILRINEILGI